MGHKVRAGDPGGPSQVRGQGIEYKKRHFFCSELRLQTFPKWLKKNEVVLPSAPPNMVLDNEAALATIVKEIDITFF